MTRLWRRLRTWCYQWGVIYTGDACALHTCPGCFRCVWCAGHRDGCTG